MRACSSAYERTAATAGIQRGSPELLAKLGCVLALICAMQKFVETPAVQYVVGPWASESGASRAWNFDDTRSGSKRDLHDTRFHATQEAIRPL